MPALTEHFGNPASTTHSYGWFAEELVSIAREHLARLINAKPEEIIFTSGATESNNLAIRGIIEKEGDLSRKERSRIVSVKTEHASVLEPLEMLKNRGYKVGIMRVSRDGLLEDKTLNTALHSDALLCSVMLANNEIGVVQDISRLVKLAGARVKYFHCDAAQALGKIPIDVDALGIDLMSLSAHKIYGPKGIGALYVRKTSGAAALCPQLLGGGHEKGLRAGTQNVPAIVGFGEAAKIAKDEMEQDSRHANELRDEFLRLLTESLDNIEVNGSLTKRIPGNLNLLFKGIDAVWLLGRINTKLAVSLSSACHSASSTPSHVLKAIGLSEAEQRSSVRFGFGRFNTKAEVISAAESIIEAQQNCKTP